MDCLFLLAVAEDIPGWAGVVGTLTGGGFAVWYAWHTTTRTIPEQIKTHAATVEKLVNEFRTETKEQRNEYMRRSEVSVDLARQGHKAIDQMSSAIHDLTRTLENRGSK